MTEKIKEQKWLAILAVIVFSLFSQGQVANKTTVPIKITSDRLEVNNINNHVLFEGNVEAVREDIIINSERLEVFNNQKERKIDKIIASGQVRIKQGNRLAKAEQAQYYTQEGKIILLGGPMVVEDDNLISGNEIVLLLQDNKSIVKGNVKVVFYPHQENRDILFKPAGKSKE